MDEEDGGELLKSTVESLPLMQTLRMLSASHARLEQASGKVSSIVSNIDGLKTDSSELSNLIASLQTDRQSDSSSLVTSARELSASIKTDAEHKYNIWRDVAENVRNALDVNDLEVAHRNLQELKRLAMHKLLPQGSTLRGGDLPSDETSTNITPNFHAVYAEFSRRLREAIITVHWSRLAKLDLSQTLKHVMIMKSLGLDLHAELRVLFLNCRSQALDAQIARVKPLRLPALASSKPSASSTQQLTPSAFITKLIELHRSFLLDTVTHYNSLLLADPQVQRSTDDSDAAADKDAVQNVDIFSGDKNAAGKSVLFCWLDSRLDIFRQLVADFISNPDCIQRMESIYSQLMYFGLSLARIYYDARVDFVSLVENALVQHVDNVVKSATESFTQQTRAAAQRFTTLIWLLDATSATENFELKYDAVQQQIVSACKGILEQFCRHIQHEALDPIRSCALQTLSIFVYRRVIIEALDILHAEVRDFTRLISDAVPDVDDGGTMVEQQKPKVNSINFKPVIEMAVKVDQHLRACVEICYPLDELRQQQLAGFNFSATNEKLTMDSGNFMQLFYDSEISPDR